MGSGGSFELVGAIGIGVGVVVVGVVGGVVVSVGFDVFIGFGY